MSGRAKLGVALGVLVALSLGAALWTQAIATGQAVSPPTPAAAPAVAFDMDTQGSTPVSSAQEMASEPQHPLQGQPAPAVELTTLDGKPFKLADVQQPIVILDFWATWCGPCRMALPKLQELANWARNTNQPAAVYTVNIQETPKQVQAFWDQQGFTMPVLMDRKGKVAKAYGVEGIPQTVLIARGKVAFVQVGYNPNMDKLLKEKIKELAAQTQPSK